MNYRSASTPGIYKLYACGILLFGSGCAMPVQQAVLPVESSAIELLSFRFREDFNAELNVDAGWSAPE